MAADLFFARWAKAKPDQAPPVAPAADPHLPIGPVEPVAPPVAPPAPTMDDVANLTRDSDYAPFIARGVDPAVQRGAMKKLFSNPHFNLMDGLDIYIGDYNTVDPIPAAMLALLEHAKGVLDPLSMFEKPVMQLISTPKPKPESRLEPEPEPEPHPVPEMAAAAPAFDAAADQPLLEAASPAAPDSAPDSGLDAVLDSTTCPQKTLPDTDEHTIQGL